MQSESEIDFATLSHNTGGDEDLIAELFELFTHQVEMWSRGLYVDADDDTWSSSAHTLKGSANAIAATKLSTYLEKAELLCGENNRDGARDVVLSHIETCFDQLNIEIQRWQYRRKINAIKS